MTEQEERLVAEIEAMVETNTLLSDEIVRQDKEIRELKAEIEKLKAELKQWN